MSETDPGQAAHDAMVVDAAGALDLDAGVAGIVGRSETPAAYRRPDQPGDFVAMAVPGKRLHLVMVCDQRGMIGPRACLDDETLCGVETRSARNGIMERVPLKSVRFMLEDGAVSVVSHETCETCWAVTSINADDTPMIA